MREAPPLQLDRLDLRILDQLQRNARISNLDLADAVGLSPTPCARRVRRLEESGLIRGHVTLLDQHRLGLTLTAFISISMDGTHRTASPPSRRRLPSTRRWSTAPW
jgi:Lrp/AsnC family leucine-responsive transcriptional regulator